MARTSDHPDLDRVFGAFAAYQLTGSIEGALELDLFTTVGKRWLTATELARELGTPTRGVRMLADALVAQGFLAKDSGRYGPTPTSAAFLDRRSPTFLGDAVRFLASPTLREAFANVADAVRRGGTALDGAGTTAPEHPVWVEFARAMAPVSTLTAQLLATRVGGEGESPGKVLDVAAGHGKYGIAIAERNPEARIVALDWPAVLEVAAEVAAAANVADRWSALPGDARRVDFGSGYDLVLLTNFLHHFDAPTGVSLLGKSHRALAPGGRVVIVDFIPDADRVTPTAAATFALVMLATTPAGDAYTFDELSRMLEQAGFAAPELVELPPSFSRAVIARR